MGYGKEMFEKGIYGIVNTKTDKIVYVGSTNVSFASRWGEHSRRVVYGTHSNEKLVELFESENFEFIILEAGNFTNRVLLKEEKYYTDLYNVCENGYCSYIGGGALQPIANYNKQYNYDKTSKSIRKYIELNFFQQKIYKEDKATIEQYLTDNGIKITKFMSVIKNLGFVIQRYSDKKSWLISDKLY